MNFRNKLLNSVAAASMVLGLAGSVALAQSGPSDDAVLNMDCPAAETVGVTVTGEFTIDGSAGFTGYNIFGQPYYDTAVINDLVKMDVNLTCNWSTDWAVTATIGTFQHEDGSVPNGYQSSFPGWRLSLTDGALLPGTAGYDGPVINYETTALLAGPVVSAGPPDVVEDLFGNFNDSVDTSITNGSRAATFFGIPIPFTDVPYASPGLSSASWDGQLTNLPVNLYDGKYIAPLTVSMVAD